MYQMPEAASIWASQVVPLRCVPVKKIGRPAGTAAMRRRTTGYAHHASLSRPRSNLKFTRSDFGRAQATDSGGDGHLHLQSVQRRVAITIRLFWCRRVPSMHYG